MGFTACGRRAKIPRPLGNWFRAHPNITWRLRSRRFMRWPIALRTLTGEESFHFTTQPCHRCRAARRPQTRARRDSHYRRPRSARHLSFLPCGAWRVRISPREARDRARALPSSPRSSAQPDGAPIPRSAHERVRTRRYAIFSHVVLNRLRQWVRKENANHPVESVNAVTTLPQGSSSTPLHQKGKKRATLALRYQIGSRSDHLLPTGF